MKTLLITLIALLAVFGNTFAYLFEISNVDTIKLRLLENIINNTINAEIHLLKEYDPISIQHVEGEILNHSYLIKNALLMGFSNIYASRIQLTGLFTVHLDLVLEVPHITGSVEHWKFDGDVFYGDGNVKFEIKDTKITVKARKRLLDTNYQEISVRPHVGQANVAITGIYNNEELSQSIANFIMYILNDFVNNNDKFHDFLSKVVYAILYKPVITLENVI